MPTPTTASMVRTKKSKLDLVTFCADKDTRSPGRSSGIPMQPSLRHNFQNDEENEVALVNRNSGQSKATTMVSIIAPSATTFSQSREEELWQEENPLPNDSWRRTLLSPVLYPKLARVFDVFRFQTLKHLKPVSKTRPFYVIKSRFCFSRTVPTKQLFLKFILVFQSEKIEHDPDHLPNRP